MTRTTSIVINTYNRCESLRVTLESLRQLDDSCFEVVVVNGPSVDDTSDLLASYGDTIKVECCPERNLSMSRNIGIAAAAGEFVAFLDDDAYPDPAWLSKLLPVFDDPEVAAAGGPVYDHTGVELQARYNLANRFGDGWISFEGNPTTYVNSPYSEDFVYTIGTNSCFRRAELVAMGGFDEEYEYYLDESDVCRRLVDRGWVVAALDDGFVYHKFLSSDVRTDQRAIKNRFSIVKNKVYFALRHAAGSHSMSEIWSNLGQSLEQQRIDYRRDVEHGLLTEADFQQFENDAQRAIDTAFERVRNQPVRTRPPAWFNEQRRDFLPFLTRRPTGRRLHVCLVVQDLPPAPVNGVSRLVHTLAVELAAQGHVVRVLTAGESHDRVDLEEGVWVHRLVSRPHPPRADRPLPAHIWNRAASVAVELARVAAHRPVDVVHVPSWDAEGAAIIGDPRYRTVYNLVTPVLTVASMDPRLDESSRAIQQLAAAERYAIAHADAILASSRGVVDEIEGRYRVDVPEERVTLIPYGLPDATAASPAAPASGRPAVLFVGRNEPRKGIDTLLACIPGILDRFPDASLTVVGDDTPVSEDGRTYRQRFESSPAAARLEGRVRFAGIVTDEELVGHYAHCDVFVAPSRFESFGLILIEAMRQGKPVIAADVGGMVDIVEHEGNGLLVPPGDPAALASALARMLADGELRDRWGRRSRELFEERFSAAAMAREVQDLYYRLVGEPAPAVPVHRPGMTGAVDGVRTPIATDAPAPVTGHDRSSAVVENAARMAGGADGGDVLTRYYDEQFDAAEAGGGSIYGVFTPMLAAAHERRMELLDQLPIGDVSDKVCADYGVGSWGFAAVYPRLQGCRRAIGLDISASAIEQSRRRSATGDHPYGDRFEYLVSRGDDLQLSDASVDVFFTGECIEHIENTELFLDEVHRVLRPGGILVLTTPNADANLYGIRGERFGVGPEHVSLMGYQELLGYLAGPFEVTVAKGFNVSMTRQLDEEVLDAEVARAWASLFEDRPDLATGVIVLARRRDSHSRRTWRQRLVGHDDPAVRYVGQWDVAPLAGSLTARRSCGRTQDRVEIDVEGTDVLLIMWVHAWSGSAKVLVDGIGWKDVSLFSPVGGFKRLHIRGLEAGPHTVTIQPGLMVDRRSAGRETLFFEAVAYQAVEVKPQRIGGREATKDARG